MMKNSEEKSPLVSSDDERMLTDNQDPERSWSPLEKLPDKEEIKAALSTWYEKTPLQNRIMIVLTIILYIYIFIMDILTFIHIQRIPIRTADPKPINTFNYWAMLSIKGIMEDHLSIHILYPLCEYFEQITHLSSARSFVSANSVSVFGLLLAIPACKLCTSKSLTYRRVGVILFIIRLWVDGLDGVVFRMQHFTGAAKHQQTSVRHSSGWFVDTTCDFGAAFFFLYAVYYQIRYNICRPSSTGLPLCCNQLSGNKSDQSPPATPRELTTKFVLLRLVWVVLVITCCSSLWDYFVGEYHSLFEKTYDDPTLQRHQNQLLKSASTSIIMWCWRMANGVSLINFAFMAMAYDKIWLYLALVQYVATCVLIALTMITMLHLDSIKAILH